LVTIFFKVAKLDYSDFFLQKNITKQLEKWSKDGKDVEKFDPVWMGLYMFTLPTKAFGWEGITQTMAAVSPI